jgi:hypothetical protein
MKKNNYLFFIAVMILASCSRKEPQTLLSRWSPTSLKQEFSFLERKLASAEGSCMEEAFNLETLKAEVREAEKKFPTETTVQGQWKHLDLSTLPIPQANFLLQFGDKIGDLKDPGRIDYSSCQDVPCIINKIYNKNDHVAGYVHYLWYLKFGTMISADNLVPYSNALLPPQGSKIPGQYNGEEIPFEDFLFDQKELLGFWRLSHVLEAPYLNLPDFKEIQRIPRNKKLIGDAHAGSCGLAYSEGWILLTDGCLTFSYKLDFGSSFFTSVAHEMSHQLDFFEGKGSKELYRSKKQDFMLFTQNRVEYKDADGKTVMNWKPNPELKVVTGYARTNPVENFAETMAYYRLKGDFTKGHISKEQYTFFGETYFDSKEFTSSGLLKIWINENSNELSNLVLKSVIDCSKSKNTLKSSYFKGVKFSQPIMPDMLNCISNGADVASSFLRGKILSREPEGCTVLADMGFKKIWDDEIKNYLASAYNEKLSEAAKDKNYLARIQQYYADVSNPTLARNSYISCYGNKNEEECFDIEIKKSAYDKASSLKLSPDQTIEMTEMYVNFHEFDDIKKETQEFYKKLADSNLQSIKTETESLWNVCQNTAQNDSGKPKGSFFQIDGYMVSSFYNCLNANIPDITKALIRNFSVNGHKLEYPNEEGLLVDFTLPLVANILKDIYVSEKANEKKKAEELITKDSEETRKRILGDLSWVKDILNMKKVESDCKKQALQFISFNPLFHLREELFSDYIGQICQNISGSSEFKAWIDSSKGSLAGKVSTSLDQKIIDLAMIKAQACVKQYPLDTVVNKVRFQPERDACLLNEWPKIEATVLESASGDLSASKLQVSPEALKARLESSRRRLQLRIMKSQFGAGT